MTESRDYCDPLCRQIINCFNDAFSGAVLCRSFLALEHPAKGVGELYNKHYCGMIHKHSWALSVSPMSYDRVALRRTGANA